MSDTERTLDEWVAAIMALPRPWLLAFDVDGTLAPIIERADQVRVSAAVQRDLRLLNALPAVQVAVITGRDLALLRRMLKVRGIYRAVEHGVVVLPPGQCALPAEPRGVVAERLHTFARWAEVEAVPQGAVLERKRTSRVLHVRALAASDPGLADSLLARATEQAKRVGLIPRAGRAVLEAEVTPGDKGRALARIQRSMAARGVFFAGDDYTDEPALAHATERGGIGLFVSSVERPTPPSSASGAICGADEMAELIRRLRVALTPPPRRLRGHGGSGGTKIVRLRGASEKRRSATTQAPTPQ